MLTTRYAKIVMSVVACVVLPARRLRQHHRLRHELSVRAARDEHGYDLSRQRTHISGDYEPDLWHLAYAAIIAAGRPSPARSFLVGGMRLFQARLCASRSLFNEAKALRHRRVPTRVPHLGLRLHGGGRGMVRHVAIANVECPGAPQFRILLPVLAVLIFVALPRRRSRSAVPSAAPKRRRNDRNQP